MKTAKTKDGERVEASEEAPQEAICMYCGGVVILRGRRRMGTSKKSYFWRHLDNKNMNCRGRSRSGQ
ncbi:MAG: hypothetical protein R3293_23620 [Candidatus Promineifilaceae bacterium]|nr:hypothetical protein [Candidatus Promineifilaceae bacterium]